MAGAQEYSNGVGVSNIEFVIDGLDLVTTADLDFSKIEADATEERFYDLVIFAGENSITLPAARLLGRNWYMHYARERRTNQPFGEGENAWIWNKAPVPLHFVAVTPYQEWMSVAKIRIDARIGGCCGKPGRSVTGMPVVSAVLPTPEPERPVYRPEFLYVLPPAETTVKQRDISGEAYVVFASGKTTVDPQYKDNAVELDKIRATIDEVSADADVTITDVLLRGYSSPDGKHSTNQKLATARTQAIEDYVESLYDMDKSVFRTEAVAENWEGLKALVLKEDMPAKDQIIEIIDSDLDPDRKEAKLKQKYPKQWKQMVANMFPLLRRTDYKVSYTIRTYTTTEDARRIMHQQPDKLSITEFFLAAQGYTMGTNEFDEVFAIAARVYPDNEVVNINAANAALSLGRMQKAEAYLEKAGDSPVARYTRGVCCAMQENWEDAVMYFTSAKASGVKEADAALEVTKQLLELDKK